MWEVGGKTLRGCRVPIHPGQRDPVQGGRVCRDGDGGLEDGLDERGADSQLHLQHRVLLSLGLWTEAGLADLREFQLPAESKGLQEGISISQDGPGNSIDMRVDCEKLVLFFFHLANFWRPLFSSFTRPSVQEQCCQTVDID